MKKVNKIVLIDDDEITCWLNKSLLEDMQAAEHVELFHDSRQALDYISKNYKGITDQQDEIDLIFLEVHLPIMDGFEFLEELQKLENVDRSKFLVIILTTYLHEKDKTKAALSFKDVLHHILQKPLKSETLKGLLESLK